MSIRALSVILANAGILFIAYLAGSLNSGSYGFSCTYAKWPVGSACNSHEAVLADIARTLEELDRARLADVIAEMEAKLAEKEGDELDRALERLDQFKTVQQQVSSTAMH